jgi:hypothetical protein
MAGGLLSTAASHPCDQRDDDQATRHALTLPAAGTFSSKAKSAGRSLMRLSCRTVVLVSTARTPATWTLEQALEEIERVLRDAGRHAAANGGRWGAAMSAAECDAINRSLTIRDEARADAGDFARLVARWVYERAGLPTERACHLAALRAVQDDPVSNWLAADLHRFIDSYRDGFLSGEGFVRMLKKPLLGRPRTKSAPPAAGDFPFEAAESTLQAMLEQASVNPQSDPAAAFEEFAAFAKLSAGANATHRVEDDSFFCEYATSGGDFTVVLGRQFSLADRDGDYSHMQQLHLTFGFSAKQGDDDGVLWADGDIDAWLTQLLATRAGQAIATREATSAMIRLSDV